MSSASPRKTTTPEKERWDLADRALAAKRSGRHGITRFADEGGLAASTVRCWAWVAQQFPRGQRRIGAVSFSVHLAVASSADRFGLIERADTENWTAAQARAEMALAPSDPTPRPVEPITNAGPASLDAATAYCRMLGRVDPTTQLRLRDPLGAPLASLAAAAASALESLERVPG